jgi:hypothetical protein
MSTPVDREEAFDGASGVTVERVIARVAGHRVSAFVADERVRSGPSAEEIVVLGALEDVSRSPSEERVDARSALESISVWTAEDEVVASTTVDEVGRLLEEGRSNLAGARVDHVLAGPPKTSSWPSPAKTMSSPALARTVSWPVPLQVTSLPCVPASRSLPRVPRMVHSGAEPKRAWRERQEHEQACTDRPAQGVPSTSVSSRLAHPPCSFV